ncbi:hypothetical protein D3C72_1770390 [compost metagenome]
MPVLTETELIGIWVPTLRVASALLRTKIDGVCSRRRLVTLSSAVTTAAAFLPRKVQPTPPSPTAPERLPQIDRPSALGRSMPLSVLPVVTACSKNQLTP